MVTGLGAVTPIGNDARATWRAARRRRERRRLDPRFRRERVPGADRGRGEGLRRDGGRLAEGGAEARAQRAARARRRARGGRATPGLDGAYEPGPRRHPLRHGDRRLPRDRWSSTDVLRERGPDRVSPTFIPSVLADAASGQLAISLGFRGPNYAPVSACATGSHAVGEAAELVRRGDADAVLAGGAEACMHPLILAGFCAMRGLVAEEEHPPHALAAVRRDARRVRDGRGRVRARARGAGGGAEARRDASTRRSSATARRTTRTTWRSRIPSSIGVAEMMRQRARACRRRARAGRVHQRARDVDAARRRSPRRTRSRTSSASMRTSSPSPRRSRSPATASARPARSRR